MKKFRELIAQNREQRLRLEKNIEKVSRQIARAKARTADAVQTTHSGASEPQEVSSLKASYERLGKIFSGMEARTPTARKALERLIIRCQACAAGEVKWTEQGTQIEGLRFEFVLLLRAQGIDEPQVAKYGAAEELIAQISSALTNGVKAKKISAEEDRR